MVDIERLIALKGLIMHKTTIELILDCIAEKAESIAIGAAVARYLHNDTSDLQRIKDYIGCDNALLKDILKHCDIDIDTSNLN